MSDAGVRRVWQCGGVALDLGRPRVMGILNVTPDSFSDGGPYADPARAIAHGQALHADGADIVDVGGESTRPGAVEVPVDVEIARVVPVVAALAGAARLVSVDTSKPQVMTAAIDAGAAIVNDVRALREPGAIEAVARTGAGVCLMHMQGEPRTMQHAPAYADVVAEVEAFLLGRAQRCIAGGIARERIAIDPGLGFGKTLAHNLALLNALPRLAAHGYPVVVGYSRKSSLGTLAGRPVGERLAASLGAALAAVERGASVVRVHDVRETVDALKVWCAVRDAG
jgi:dihydropteroate synthase